MCIPPIRPSPRPYWPTRSNDEAAKSTTALTGSKRVYVVDPALLVQSGDAIVTRYASGAVAGAIARSDNERGW
ncbi:hypothetical protein G6F23_015893 [Rhizopus arrhizus]|nr:hypothetical protein G6F23_015893 [Rhizopus arrhizus]